MPTQVRILHLPPGELSPTPDPHLVWGFFVSGVPRTVPQEDFTNHWLTRPTTRMGAPDGDRYAIADTGVQRRDYTRGVVLVNPTAGPRTVSLGGTFTTASGRVVSRVTLRSATGVLLRDQP